MMKIQCIHQYLLHTVYSRYSGRLTKNFMGRSATRDLKVYTCTILTRQWNWHLMKNEMQYHRCSIEYKGNCLPCCKTIEMALMMMNIPIITDSHLTCEWQENIANWTKKVFIVLHHGIITWESHIFFQWKSSN